MSVSSGHRKVPQPVGRHSYLSAVLAGLLAILLVGIALDAYFQVQRLTDPEILGDRIEAAVREHYPDFQKELVDRVHAKAPEFAEQVSEELIQTTPDLRAKLERFAGRELEQGIDEVTDLSAAQFRELLNQNRQTVVAAFKEIEQAPDEARTAILEAEADLEKTLGVDLQRQARNAVKLHRQLNDKLERLNDADQTLDGKELLERRIVRILRTMQVEQTSVASTN